MDRISALRNVEDALSEFEAGETDLAETEKRVLAVLRTYATEFEAEGVATYRTSADGESVLVVADGPETARERAADRLGVTPDVIEVDRPDSFRDQ